MSDNAIRFREQEAGTLTIAVKRDGAAKDLTGKTVKFYARDPKAAFGTNFVNALACTITDAAAGMVTAAITQAHTTIASPDRDLSGIWAVSVETTATPTDDEWFGYEPFIIGRNPFLAE